MNKKETIVRVAAFCLILALSGTTSWLLSQDTAEGLYEAALLKKEANGDLQGAIQLFQKILKQFPEKREVAAKAQFQIGACYEKMGTAEAVKAYELVLKNFADQPELVAAARERLAALRGARASESAAQQIFAQGVDLECSSLSADGTKVAAIEISQGQNVGIYDLASQRLQLITHFTWSAGSCFTYFPVLSPDGKEVAYATGCWDSNSKTQDATEIRVSKLDGTTRTLYRAQSADIVPCGWLPDGKTILAYLLPTDKPASLGLVPAAGGTIKNLMTLMTLTAGANSFRGAAPADASPDGRYVAFQDGPADGKRDIYIMAMEGGSPVALSDHPADDKEPRWSPDGKHVVFLSDRQGSWGLWGVTVSNGMAAGPAFLIREGLESPMLFNWTKSGLAFSIWINMRDIYTASFDSKTLVLAGIPKPLDYSPTGVNSNPVWSPDGKFLAFAATSLTEPGQGSIVIWPASGGKARTFGLQPLARKGIMFLRELLWRPDGSGLAFSTRDSIDQWWLCELPLQTGEWMIGPAKGGWIRWKPDGSGYYYFAEGGLLEHELKAGKETPVIRIGEKASVSKSYNLAFSRDDKFAAWVNEFQKAGSPSKFGHQITVWDRSTGMTRTLEGDYDCPVWAPDGRHLLALGSYSDNNVPTAIYVLGLEDGTARKIDLGDSLPKSSELLSISLSPDGGRLAFSARMVRLDNLLIKNVIPSK
jgi:Tol biopolymer transport system component